MRVIKFPFILDGGDGGYYFLDAKDKKEAEALAEFAADAYGYMFEDPKLIDDLENESAVYDALTKTRYEPLGYNTYEELMNAYESDPELSDSHAYSMDGVEGAVIGVTEDGSRFVYDYDKIIECLQTNDGISEEEALEWYSYNMERSFPYYQPCPIIVRVLEE